MSGTCNGTLDTITWTGTIASVSTAVSPDDTGLAPGDSWTSQEGLAVSVFGATTGDLAIELDGVQMLHDASSGPGDSHFFSFPLVDGVHTITGALITGATTSTFTVEFTVSDAPPAFQMPDITGLTELQAVAALIDAGAPDSTPVLLYGSFQTGAGGYDDLNSATRGRDGTVSFQGGDVGHWMVEGTDNVLADIWGVEHFGEFVTPLRTTTLGDWVDETLYPQGGTSGLRFELTTLHKPDTPATVLAKFPQYDLGNSEVRLAFMDQARAQVTISDGDPALKTIKSRLGHLKLAKRTALRVWDAHRVVFWAPVSTRSWDGAGGKLTLTAVDQERLQRHFIRRGDDALDTIIDPRGTDGSRIDSPHHDEGDITIDYRGLRTILAAARDTTAQTDRGMPDIAILEGANTAETSTLTMRVERGQGVWDTMHTLVDHETSCEFRLMAINQPGAYMTMLTYPPGGMGTDRRDTLKLHFGHGVDNLSGFTAETGNVITHAHELSSDKDLRVTRADVTSSGEIGAYVDWDVSDVSYRDANHETAREALAARAQEKVDAYGDPPENPTIDIKPGTIRYLTDVDLGDLVRAHGRQGEMDEIIEARVTAVTLRGDASDRTAVTLELVPHIGTAGDSDEEA